MRHSHLGRFGRLAVAAVVCSATLIGVGQGPARASHANVTAVNGLAFNYFTDVSLFGGPKMLRGYGQFPCTDETPNPDVPAGCTPAADWASSSSPSVACPAGGGSPSVTDPNGARGVYGPATIFGGQWPASNGVAPPSGPLKSSLTCQLGEGGSVTGFTSVSLMPTGSTWFPPGATTAEAHPGGAGPGPFIADKVTSTCTANANGTETASAKVVVGKLETKYDADGNPIQTEDVPISPPVNYTRSGTIDHVGDSYRIVFNEQTVNPNGSLTVIAAHMYLLGPTAVGDMVIGSSTCGLTASAIPHLVSVGDASVYEGDAGTRAAVFTVSLSAPSASTVTVKYATANGSAGAPADYTATTGTLSFAPNITSMTVKVPVIGDVTDELPVSRSFTVGLSDPVGATIADATGVGGIVDDDPPTVTGKRLAIGDVAVHEGDAGSRSAIFTVSLSKAHTAAVTVNFATANGIGTGGATAGDYTAKTGTLSFAAGVTSLTVKVNVTPDNLTEGNETFTVNLTEASGATVTDTSGQGTIISDESP